MEDKLNSTMLAYINVDKKMNCLFIQNVAIFICLAFSITVFYKPHLKMQCAFTSCEETYSAFLEIGYVEGANETFF